MNVTKISDGNHQIRLYGAAKTDRLENIDLLLITFEH